MCDVKVEITDEDIAYQTVLFSTEDFLKEYEKYPCLWDKKHVQFRNKYERVRCEENMCDALDIPDTVFLRKKIRSIRGTYNTEIRKIKQSIDNCMEIYPPKLTWFPLADTFLRVTTDLPYDVYPLVKEIPVSFRSGYQKHKGVSLLVLDGKKAKRQKLNSEGDYTKEERQEETNTHNDEILEHYEEYEELESSIQGDVNTEDFKSEVAGESNFDQAQQSEVASTVLEKTKGTSTSHLSAIAKCLKTLTKSSENEFAAFGQWLALQLQSMPLELALQMQMDIQAHLTKSRAQYMKNSMKV